MYYSSASTAVIINCRMGATKIIRSTDERRTTMVKKINGSEFEQVKIIRLSLLIFGRVVRPMQDACAGNGAAF